MSYDSVISRGHLDVLRGRPVRCTSALDQMSPALDDLSLKFVVSTRDARHDGLDIGCGDGIATAAALARGAHVTAVDSDQRALLRLLARIPPRIYPRLKVRRARVQDLDFKFAHFSAVHASRILHLLDPAALQQSLRKFFRWLYPEGRLFISTLASSGPFWDPIRAELARRQQMREPWPGFIEHFQRYEPCRDDTLELVHLIDEPVLRRELEFAGFVIDEMACASLPWDSEQQCCSVIAHCADQV